MEQQDGAFDWETPLGQLLGFTDDKFGGYLFKRGNQIWISAVMSKQERQGNLSRLFNAIEDHGFEIMVPLPLPKMQSILEKKGFIPEEDGNLTVWRKAK